MVYDPRNTNFILCEESRNQTKNGMNVAFVDYITGSSMRYMYIKFIVLLKYVDLF